MNYLNNQAKLHGLRIKELDGNRFCNTGYKIYNINNGFTVALFKDIDKATQMQKDTNFMSTLKTSDSILNIK